MDRFFSLYPEVFPPGFERGYKLHDKKGSKKIKGFIIRRVKLKNGRVYEIVPTHIMPYLSGYTEEVSKGLLLPHWAVPYEVIALVLGRNAMYWERQQEALGRISLVGSLCKKQEVPAHLAAHLLEWQRSLYCLDCWPGMCVRGSVIHERRYSGLTISIWCFQTRIYCLSKGVYTLECQFGRMAGK